MTTEPTLDCGTPLSQISLGTTLYIVYHDFKHPLMATLEGKAVSKEGVTLTLTGDIPSFDAEGIRFNIPIPMRHMIHMNDPNRPQVFSNKEAAIHARIRMLRDHIHELSSALPPPTPKPHTRDFPSEPIPNPNPQPSAIDYHLIHPTALLSFLSSQGYREKPEDTPSPTFHIAKSVGPAVFQSFFLVPRSRLDPQYPFLVEEALKFFTSSADQKVALAMRLIEDSKFLVSGVFFNHTGNYKYK